MFEGVDDILKELSPEQQAACTAPNKSSRWAALSAPAAS